MPTVAASHFVLDLPTVFVVTVFLSLTGGMLLIFAWLQNRNTPALAFWGGGTCSAPARQLCWRHPVCFPMHGRSAAPMRSPAPLME